MQRQGFTALEVAIVLLVLGLAALFAYGGRMRHDHKSSRTKCGNNLRMLGLAALQYADDKRFLPHVGPITKLDGDFHDGGPTTTTKVARALVRYGYHDNPEGWICPSSFDLYRPPGPGGPNGSPATWFWAGQSVTSATSPFIDGLADPALADTDELSYGWTRKGLNANCRHTSVLAADRAVRDPAEEQLSAQLRPGELGNHPNGWNVLYSDASVNWVALDDDLGAGPPAAQLPSVTTSADAGFLAIRDQSASLGAGS